MHLHTIDGSSHDHAFLGARHEVNARRIRLVAALTGATMIAEIVGGSIFNSMALVADGWHMATHAGALGMSALAYTLARRFEDDPRFAFGTGKIGDLAAFTSGVVLVVIALFVASESVFRLVRPVPIAYAEAIVIATLGLIVNLASAILLRDHADHHRHHHHDPHGTPGHSHLHEKAEDNNLRSAYLHVLADATTSIAAIAGLVVAQAFDLPSIDPVVGLAGTVMILSWAFGLLRDSGGVLLDCVPDRGLAESVRRRLEAAGDEVTDLHLWQLGPGHKAAVISVVAASPQPPSIYKARLADLEGLCHVTVEVTSRGLDRIDTSAFTKGSISRM
jgi:cation diffusion facilitator family transporter